MCIFKQNNLILKIDKKQQFYLGKIYIQNYPEEVEKNLYL